MVRLGVTLVVLVAALASPAAAETPLLSGTVGPGFTIALVDSNGAAVKHLDPGAYAVHVDDLSEFHNFHLAGPGVDLRTSLTDVESVDWQVQLVDGTYAFLCDVHPTMKGAFTVGTVSVPVHKLAGAVGPGGRIVLARTAPAGKAKITIRDRSAKDNFHLSGPGVNARTGVAFKGTVTWNVTLKPGRYSFRSDKHPKLHGTLTVS